MRGPCPHPTPTESHWRRQMKPILRLHASWRLFDAEGAALSKGGSQDSAPADAAAAAYGPTSVRFSKFS